MNTYRIECVNGQFEVVVYKRRWFRERRHVIHRVERLAAAEELFLGAIGKDFAKVLDQRRFAVVSATLADCDPRADEEHIYTAIVLQHGGPAERHGIMSPNIHEIAEKMVGGKMTNIEQRLFLHRFMTWYARENPQYSDPRLYDGRIFTASSGMQDAYAGPVAPPITPAPSVGRTLLGWLGIGRKK